ncbi:hypothetical protein EJ07DRAFT_106999, partial [Lizonia empirigonia]
KTRLPVRSALFKQRTGGLVVRWVTTGESPLLYVFLPHHRSLPHGPSCYLRGHRSMSAVLVFLREHDNSHGYSSSSTASFVLESIAFFYGIISCLFDAFIHPRTLSLAHETDRKVMKEGPGKVIIGAC